MEISRNQWKPVETSETVVSDAETIVLVAKAIVSTAETTVLGAESIVSLVSTPEHTNVISNYMRRMLIFWHIFRSKKSC